MAGFIEDRGVASNSRFVTGGLHADAFGAALFGVP